MKFTPSDNTFQHFLYSWNRFLSSLSLYCIGKKLFQFAHLFFWFVILSIQSQHRSLHLPNKCFNVSNRNSKRKRKIYERESSGNCYKTTHQHTWKDSLISPDIHEYETESEFCKIKLFNFLLKNVSWQHNLSLLMLMRFHSFSSSFDWTLFSAFSSIRFPNDNILSFFFSRHHEQLAAE